MQKLLTKSRFKLAIECPNKLYFTSNPFYVNKKSDDSFLQALAEGGFQVEELARLSYVPGNFVEADHYEYQKALDKTQSYFQSENVILYEAAFGFGNLFVRTDVVVKHGNKVKLVEVKAKSFDSTNPNTFNGKRGGLVASWKPYLFDLAFQKYVAQKNYPDLQFEAYLMMADKTKAARVDGLNQLFRIPKNGDPRKDVVRRVNTLDEIGDTVLTEMKIEDLINDILGNKYKIIEDMVFEEAVSFFEKTYLGAAYPNWPLKFSTCRKCEFKASSEELKEGKLSGFQYCLKKQLNWSDKDFNEANAFEICNYRKGDEKLDEGIIKLKDFKEEDFNVKVEAGKMTQSERQWIQVQKSAANDTSIHVLKDDLQVEMSTWKFPLHFIDFETSIVALPFTKDRRPYEQVAFQFSHHLVFEDGRVEHHDEFICDDAGKFPNFHFARALKRSLEAEEGTIFRFSNHENMVINVIIKQLRAGSEVDKNELITFLKHISHSKKDSVEKWKGARDMVDLCEVIKNYYYNPFTKGSNSIKYVLPAILQSSAFLQAKYAKPISEIGLTSHNFSGAHVWLLEQEGQVINPYKALPPLFTNWSDEELDEMVSELEGISDGGTALTAYAKLQFTDMAPSEREELIKGLLKYCELDTLAMVMIYEHFKYDILNN